MQNRHREIIIIFTVLQCLVLIVFGYTPYPDSEGYIRLAQDSLLYGEWYPVTHKIQELAFIWNLGAINAVVLSLRLFGSVIPLLILYSLLKGATAWLVFRIAQTIFDNKVAYIALLLYVLYPANYGEGTSAHSELPFVFLSLSGVYLAVCRQQSLAGGAVLAIANWFRPMAIVFLLAIFLYQRKSVVKSLAGYMLTITLIGGACYLRTGYFIYQARTGWMALLQYSVDHTPDTSDDHLPLITDTDAVKKDDIWRSRFFTWLKSHPKEYIALMPYKLINTYASDNVNLCAFLSHKAQRKYLYDELSMPTLHKDFPKYSGVQLLTILNLIYYYLLLAGFVAGAIILCRQRRWQELTIPLSVVIIGTLILLLAGHGEARFHNPFMPFFIMMSAVTVHRLITSCRLRNESI